MFFIPRASPGAIIFRPFGALRTHPPIKLCPTKFPFRGQGLYHSVLMLPLGHFHPGAIIYRPVGAVPILRIHPPIKLCPAKFPRHCDPPMAEKQTGQGLYHPYRTIFLIWHYKVSLKRLPNMAATFDRAYRI